MLTIKGRLLTALSFIFVSVVAVAGIGHYGSSVATSGMETVYNDRIIHLKDLKALSDLYSINIVGTAHKVRNGNLDWQAGVERVSDAITDIEKNWTHYNGVEMTAEERKLANDALAVRVPADAAATSLLAILKAQDRLRLDSFVVNDLYGVVDPLRAVMGGLMTFQIDEARRQYESVEAAVARANLAKILGVLTAAGAIGFALWVAMIGVSRPLAAMTDCMQRLAAGERGLEIPGVGRQDEVGLMAQSVQVFKETAEETLRLREAQKEAEAEAARQRKADMQRLANQFQDAVGSIIETVTSASGQLESAANALTQTAEATHHRSGIVAAASEQTAPTCRAWPPPPSSSPPP